MSGTTDWTTAVAIVVSGLILGSMFVYFVVRRRQGASAPDPELRDLEGKRDALVQQLREMDDAGSSGEERTRLELETAHVLRAIDERRRAAPAVVAPEAQPAMNARRATIIGFVWGAGSMLALALLGYFVMQSARPRQETPPQAPPQAPRQASDPALRQLEDAVKAQPDDLGKRLQLAQAYLERENLMGVFEQTQYVLSKSPNEPRALTYQALVRMSMGQSSDAVAMLQQATKSDPSLLDAWVALAWVHTQEGRSKEAGDAMQEAIRRHPEEKERLEQVVKQMKAHQNNAPAAVAAADVTAIHVTIELDPSARARAKGGVLFVIARPEGVTTGPPVAAKRLNAASLPITFDLGAADSMMGQALPPKVRIEARLDSDGDAATKSPTDPHAAQDSVPIGATIKLSLK